MPSEKKSINETLIIPDKVEVSIQPGLFVVKGPKGSVTKRILIPGCTAKVENKTVVLSSAKATRREQKILFTARAHLRNLFRGVTEGHVYKLKICSGHFPMTVSVKNNVFEIKNFYGEVVSRRIPLIEGVTVKIAAPEIVVEGIDLDKTSQTAANIEQITRRPGFDFNRFQDGIYIVEKDGKPVL
jgi:large subunit ribosomal protein L6